MANALYDLGREGFLAADIDWDADNIKLVFIDEADDTPALATDQFLIDRASASRVATSGNFASKTVTAGTADAADVTVTSVSGDQFESIDIYADSGAEGTSRLICNIDTATGLPLTPNGGDVDVVWDSGADKIFTL